MGPVLIEEVLEDASVTSTKISLTEVEEKVCRLLLDVVDYIEQNPVAEGVFESQVKLPQELREARLTVRFTGGWVRDKLLGRPSHDIDVAINKMTGEQFGIRLEEYMRIPGNAQKYDLDGVAENVEQDQHGGKTSKSRVVGGLHKIDANPEKSKHLETVCTRILGLDIDLVNLRKETYTDDSRNPQIEFGTPEEDALRRDATANAMFYNIHTEQVEDFTGCGYSDLRSGILRTPLEPCQTFKDDPLRVLRLIRFASRLGWTIDPLALEAMRHDDIKYALRRKISRERVGIELEKALRGPDPREALRLIFQLGLYDTVFCDPALDSQQQQQPELQPDLENWSIMLDCAEDIIQSSERVTKVAIRDSEEQFLAWQLAALVPYRNAPVPEAQLGRKALPPFSAVVAREGIKATNKVCDVVAASARRATEISTLVHQLFKQKTGRHQATQPDTLTREALGMRIRTWGSTWRSQVVYALLVDVADNAGTADACQLRYANFLEHLQKLDLLDVCELRPLLDGKTLATALDTKPGPWMKEALDVVMAWQLRNPGDTDTSKAIEEVKMHGELATSLAKHFLKLTIRPSFSKTKQSGITEQARRDTSGRLQPKVTADDETVTKLWKQASEQHVLSLLTWCVKELNQSNVEQVWPLIIPPILTLIDDWETRYKKFGTTLLKDLLTVTPVELLRRTGLGPVFEQALLPTLTYFPPLVSEEESLMLLPSVYNTLTLLAFKRFPDIPVAPGQPLWKVVPPDRTKALDKIMRKGILYEYTHVSERPAIVIMLFEALRGLVESLGDEAIKHLKYVLPMLNQTLTHRLGRHHLGMLRSAVRGMFVVVQVCRARMMVHRAEVLKGLTLCWLNINGDTTDEAESLRFDLRECVKELRSIVEQNGEVWVAERAILISADARLENLLD